MTWCFLSSIASSATEAMVQSFRRHDTATQELPSNMSLTLSIARVVFPVTAPPIRNGAVAAEDGRILAVGTATDLQERYPGARMVDLGERALLPGLVNAHTHLE